MNTNRKTIEFNEPVTSPIAFASPWTAPSKTRYQDLILKPEFAERCLKFPIGSTWMRILPSLKGSDKGWMLGVHALQYPGGRHAHPKTITAGKRSVFDHAYSWCKENRMQDLFSKQNKEGFRLLADPFCLFWVLVEEDGKPVARLLLAKGYDGSRGGVPGLGHQIWQLTQELDEDGNPVGNPLDAQTGVQVCVEKRQSPGARYPSYSLRMGRVPAPVAEMIDKMDSEEVAALTPLEQVIRQQTEEEEWKLLENVIAPETVSQIRESLD